ncbi:hypothetical protein [Candidatus Albibeggiatoa sp. nov. BB20]|uniref:hypothetical protein n=1 Tax=Candidatus Albibeggiatoa sp. nov. BB20 TaxID=3162723 RepID=UPI0033658288
MDTQTILAKLQNGYRLYHRHQEKELAIDYLGKGRFVLSEAEFMGESHSRELSAEELGDFLARRFSSINAIERLLLPVKA